MVTNARYSLLIAALLGAPLLSACYTRVPTYLGSPTSAPIYSKDAPPLSISQVLSIGEEPTKAVACRWSLPIRPPRGEPSFEKHLHRALQADLKGVGAADLSPARLVATLNEISLSTPVSSVGTWRISLSVGTQPQAFEVVGTTNFPSPWDGDVACSNAAASFNQAVENLIANLLEDPRLLEMVGRESTATRRISSPPAARLDYGAKKKAVEALTRLDSGDAKGAIDLLLGILAACGNDGSCSASVRAGLHMYIGVSQGVGLGEQAAARKSFALARELNPSCPLDDSRADKRTAGTYLSVFELAELGHSVLVDEWKKDVAGAR